MNSLTVSRMVVRWITENATELFEIPLDMLRTSISRNVHSVYHYTVENTGKHNPHFDNIIIIDGEEVICF